MDFESFYLFHFLDPKSLDFQVPKFWIPQKSGFSGLQKVHKLVAKDFVREAVVERIKLEMRTAAMNSDDNAEMTQYIEELESQVVVRRWRVVVWF